MASAVYSEPPASRLSISLEGSTASASPFPSPSSSFLPPPTPGAHEFAVKPAPSTSARVNKKPSTILPQQSAAGTLEVEPPSPETETDTANANGDLSSNGAHTKVPGYSQPPSIPLNPPLSPGLNSPMTPTPSTFQRQPHLHPKLSMEYLEPPQSPAYQSNSSTTTTPTKTAPPRLPSDKEAKSNSNSPPPSKIVIPDIPMDVLAAPAYGNAPSSPAFSTTSNSRPKSSTFDASIFSSRPAPPSPAGSLSRRISTSSAASRSKQTTTSRPSSISRTNSLKRSTSTTGSARNSPVINPHRASIGSQLSQSFVSSPSPLPSPQALLFALNVQQPQMEARAAAASTSSSNSMTSVSIPLPLGQQEKVYIKVRDFGFSPSDERHMGLGVDVPKANKVSRLIRRLGGKTLSMSSVESSDGDGDEDELVDDDDWMGNGIGGGGGGGGWDGFRMGWGRITSWNVGAGGMNAAQIMESEKTHFPSRTELDKNFLDDEDDDEDDEYGTPDDDDDEGDFSVEEGDGEDALYPGLYRAMYAFEPEGTAEMRLVEDQVVRVIGRGGGVGWAVVLDESKPDGDTPRHALVPESYLEPVKLDWEEEGATPAVGSILATVGA